MNNKLIMKSKVDAVDNFSPIIGRLIVQAGLAFDQIRADSWADNAPSPVIKDRLDLLDALVRVYTTQNSEWRIRQAESIRRREAKLAELRQNRQNEEKMDDHYLMLEAQLTGQRIRMGRK